MTGDEQGLEAAEAAFNRAMISNQVSEIRLCITPDWVLVTPGRGPMPAEVMLEAIAAGRLTHDSMNKETHALRLFGDVAVVTSRGQNSGRFSGRRFEADEWITSVYRRVDGAWLCELTQLTPATASAQS